MATGFCKTCDYEPVAFGAKACPQCGQRNPNPGVVHRTLAITMWFGLLAGAAFGGLLGYLSHSTVGAVCGAMLGVPVGCFLGTLLGLVGGGFARLCGVR